MKIGDKIIHFRFLQDVSEGWHLMTSVKDLSAYLAFVQNAAYSGEVGPLCAAIVVHGVAVPTVVVDIGDCSSVFRGGHCKS